MNNEKHLIRLVSWDTYLHIRKLYNGIILYKQVGDLCLVMVKEPFDLIPEKLYGLTLSDIEMEIPEDSKDRARMFDRAGWNTRYTFPPRLFATQNLSSSDLYHTGIIMEEEARYGYSSAIIDKKRSFGGMRLTTTSWFGGAVAVFCPGVAARLAVLFESDFFVTFPSPHESRIHSALFTNAHQVHDAITEWNRVKHDENKGLSGSVFRYCAVRDEFQQIEYYDWTRGEVKN